MSSTSQYLSVASGHIDSLIDYVIDVKPYHVKLSEIVEQYLFEESIHVKIADDKQILAFFGADILPNTLTTPGVRRRRSGSWSKNIISDGNRRTWPVPITAVHKFASQNSQDKFTVDDSAVIEGFPTTGVFNVKRWDSVGVTDVRKNNIHQQESTDYFLSHGAFTFTSKPNQKWKETNLKNLSAFANNPGELFYNDVVTEFGTIENIYGGNFEEWTLTCVSTEPTILNVVGSSSGFIGQATQLVPFIHSKISFNFSYIDEDTESSSSIDDVFTLTPWNKITLAPDAPEETWSLIKTNPIALVSAPVFHSSVSRVDNPGLQIHTRSLDRQVGEITWTVVFGANGNYTINKYALENSYAQTANLIDGCSFKNDDIHFTIITTGTGFYPGDSFSFTTGPRVANYLVYGTVSGWQADAKIGEWYWNGKIGFKIPPLDYFADTYNSTIVTSEDAGEEWTTVIGNNQILKSISFQSNVFITAGDNQIAGASTNGLNWSPTLVGVVADGSSEILIITGDNGGIATSTDGGATWHTQDSHTTADLKASTFIPNLLSSNASPSATLLNCIIVVGANGTILTSVNGIGWSDQNSNTTKSLNGVTWSNDAIIAVGNDGIILRSTDRINWTTLTAPTTEHLLDVIYEPTSDSFIAVGYNGVICRSTDGGLTWFNLNTFADGNLNSIAFGNGKFVAVGDSGWTATSTDGQQWIRYRSKRLNSIAFGNGRFVAVGGKANDDELFTPLKTVHSIAEPSVYTIKFITPTKATVQNNIYGFRRGLIVGQPWEDEFTSFRLDSIPGQFEYQVGDEVRVHLAPKTSFVVPSTYDRFPYDEAKYDTSLAKITTALLYNEELFPLYHAHGAVIFKNVNPNDSFIIDKSTKDKIWFKILSASAKYPELAPLSGNNIPLEFRYYDRVVNGVPVSESNFSDLTTFIEAYLCSDPSVKVFSIAQPRYEKTNRNASATLTFDPVFFTKYLPFSSQYVLSFVPDQSYGQTIRVKISENLRTYARVRLNFTDIALVNISDSPIQHFQITGELNFTDMANVHFVEGGSLPYRAGYDQFPYDTASYDSIIHNGVLVGAVEISPGEYDWTGNDEDWVMPNPTSSPSISVEDTVDENTASASIVEGLTIIERIASSPSTIDRLSIYYNNLRHLTSPMLVEQTANEYLVTHDGSASTPTVVIESLDNLGVMQQVFPNMYPYTQQPGAISLKSFSFQLPNGFTAPFKLTIV